MKIIKYTGAGITNDTVTGAQWSSNETKPVDDALGVALLAAYPSNMTDVTGDYVAGNAANSRATLADVARKALKTPHNIGMKMFGGRAERDFDNTAANTWEDIVAIPIGFDAIQPIFMNSRNAGGTTASPTMLASCAALADASSSVADAATWTAVTVGASGAWPLTAASAVQRRNFIVGDWIGLQNSTPANGFYYVGIRSWVNGGSPITMMGNSSGTDSFTNWATKSDGRIWKRRRAAGNFASTNQSIFGASAVTANESPLIGFRYAAKGRIINVMAVGDSIFDGRGTYLGESFVYKSVVASAQLSSIYEYSNLAWNGAQYGNFINSITDAVSAGLTPDVLVFPNGSPNDISATISLSQIVTSGRRVTNILDVCKTNSIAPVICTWMPTNSSVKSYGATDSLRRDYCADWEARANSGILVCPTSTIISGVIDGGGQMQMLAGTTDDGIHPNDFSNEILASRGLTPIIKQIY